MALIQRWATTCLTASWLAARIGEIEKLTQTLPSIAVLVNDESTVATLATKLDQALADQNTRAVACPGGQVMAQENDVRVFDVQHIKGLEFEAVFFVGIDELSEERPELFDKFLYVGATRAATYLGLTTAGPCLPARISSLAGSFVEDWA
jgi:DNA helicase IV